MTLTKPQHLVLQKLTSYFKQSRARLLASIDDAYLASNILRVPALEELESISFKDKFYCIEGTFNLGNTLDPVRFAKTDLWQSWLNFTSYAVYKGDYTILMAYCIPGGGVLVVREGIASNMLGDTETGIVLQHKCIQAKCMVINPIKQYLSAWHPSPPCKYRYIQV